MTRSFEDISERIPQKLSPAFQPTIQSAEPSSAQQQHSIIMKYSSFLVLLSVFVLSSSDEVPADRGLNWYESLPAVAMDYKVHIDAGKNKNFSCFRQFHVTTLLFREGGLLPPICGSGSDVLRLHAGQSSAFSTNHLLRYVATWIFLGRSK